MPAAEAERAKRGLVITRSGEDDAPPINIYDAHGELICQVWIWNSSSGRVKAAFKAAPSIRIYREEIAGVAIAHTQSQGWTE
jgi:hypothetical protein